MDKIKKYWFSMLFFVLSFIPVYLMPRRIASSLTTFLWLLAAGAFLLTKLKHVTSLGELGGSQKKLTVVCLAWCVFGLSVGFYLLPNVSFFPEAFSSFLIFTGIMAGMLAVGFSFMEKW